MAQRGELVVPVPMVRAGAVDHLRGKIPGFASGGVVGSFAGGPSGLGSFDVREYNATTAAIEAADAAAAAAAIRADIKRARAVLAGFTGGASGNAIVSYAESFIGKVPYLWGGTTTAGWDCSGFTGDVYKHFGYSTIPRTAAQQQQWAQRTASPVQGGLAFFAGADGTASAAGHVGIVVSPTTMVDAYGTGFGTRLNSLIGSSGASGGFGVPPGGFPSAASAGSAPRASGPYQAYAERLFPRFGWGASQMSPLVSLWDRESGWNPIAQNPTSTAYGIAQFLDTTWAGFGPKTSDPYLQMLYGEEYIKQRYGSPAGAWGHETSAGWYDKGGWLPPGLSLAVNNTGRPEPVVPGTEIEELIGSVDHVAAMVGQLIGAVRQNAGDTAAGIAEALGGAAQGAVHRATYSPR
jgi:cell wall-associated NlpC family hydrolase